MRETEGDAAPPEFEDDEEPSHLLSSPPGKGGVEESWESLFTLGYCESLLKVSSSALDSELCLSCVVMEAKVIRPRMLSSVCSVLQKILVRPIPILKEPWFRSSSRSFLLL